MIEVNKQLHPSNPCHDLPQSFSESKYICPIYGLTTDNFKSHSETRIGINECWYNQQKQSGRESTTIKSKLKLQRVIIQKTMWDKNQLETVTVAKTSLPPISWQFKYKNRKMSIIRTKHSLNETINDQKISFNDLIKNGN